MSVCNLMDDFAEDMSNTSKMTYLLSYLGFLGIYIFNKNHHIDWFYLIIDYPQYNFLISNKQI